MSLCLLSAFLNNIHPIRDMRNYPVQVEVLWMRGGLILMSVVTSHAGFTPLASWMHVTELITSESHHGLAPSYIL